MSAALILAGTRPGGDPFANELGIAHKALIKINGTSLLERVVEALKASAVTSIAICCDEGPVGDLARQLGLRIISPAEGPSTSVAKAFDILGAPLLVTTSDHALLQPAWIDELIEKTPAFADLSIMLAERERVEAAMPDSKRTYLRFADGDWSGCNLFYLRTSTARKALDTWALVEADRKRPWRIAARLGVATLAAMLLRRLTMAEGLARLGDRVGVKAALVAASDGLAAVDVDKHADLDAVRAVLSGDNKGTSPSVSSR